MRGEGFDFREVMGGNKRGGVSGGVDERLRQLFADDRVEAAKRFVENDEFRAKGESAGKSRFHAHAAREMSELAVEGKIELLDEVGFEGFVPCGIKRAEIF